MKGKTLTETITREELNSYGATASYTDFGSGSGFGGGGYKGGSSFGSTGFKTDFVPSITERFNFKPDAMGPLLEYTKLLNKEYKINSSFASAIKSSPSSLGSGVYNPLLDQEWIKKTLESCKITSSSFGANSNFGRDHGLGIGYVYEEMKVDGVDLKFRLRADEDKKIGQHLNDELLMQRKDTERESFRARINLHEPFKWKK